MEAKRIKLSPTASSDIQPSMVAECSPRDSNITLDIGDNAKINNFINSLRKQLNSKHGIISFINKRDGRFKTLVDVFIRTANDLGNITSTSNAIESKPSVHLRDVTSLIANCCNYSVAACLELKQPHLQFSFVAVKILESSAAPAECKQSLVRLVANMCAHKETALFISSSSALLDKISQSLENENGNITKQSLRVLRLLADASFTRVLVLSNAGFYLGKLLAKEDSKHLKEVTSLLTRMCVRYVTDTGRQLASSDCTDRLVSLIFSDVDVNIKHLIVQLCQGSSDIRDRLSESNLIDQLVEEARKSSNKNTKLHCTLLSTFAQDAWGRATLRKIGALDLLVSRLAESEEDSEKLPILQSLKHFIHDTAGMAYLVRSSLFMNTIIGDVQNFVNENASPCQPKLRSEEDIYRPDSPLFMEIESSLRRQSADNSEPSVLHKTFYYAPPDSYSPLSSPPYSTPSNDPGSPVNSSTTSPGVSTRAPSATESVSSYADDQKISIDAKKIRKHIIDTELWLVTWQAQEDTNIPHLIREDLVNALIRYLSLVPRADFRAGKALRRMASSRTSIGTLLEMQFHIRVHNALCDVPCRTMRFAVRCSRCEKTYEFGREILREFSSHVDSGYGDSFLVRQLNSEDFDARTKAAIAKVSLLKDKAGARRRLSVFCSLAIDVLFSSLEGILQKAENSCALDYNSFEDGPPICAQIIFALSGLVSNRKIREVFEFDAPYVHPEKIPCLISKFAKLDNLKNDPDDSIELLTFKSSDGGILARIPLETACKNSEYYQGMFTSDLSEKMLNLREFQFDGLAEGCSVEEFVIFLHYLAGCRDSCSKIESASSCRSLINLADRYLCSSLREWICNPHGPGTNYLTGKTLHLFLPSALLTDMHPRFLKSCFVTLIKFSLPNDVIESLSTIMNSSLLVSVFLKLFREFLTE